ncbi:glycogen debranching enzyme GlgX [Propionibacterium sp. oral taxon 192 str. F0372]|uniref:alpha-amylase family glycosyl hydrolase n=1 Tax=Propionibacterium sp. oral taxon 192 TaxID=671222 RepID=UPI000353FED9|nr:alpha-amylase family glycosyl hydrolase [Propionibacterium sp. oral taxon 192]EPH02959.1 glycogen debranching enzyme GlgX [Propionibacterium sp. oral taxon 192 str. F0372]
MSVHPAAVINDGDGPVKAYAPEVWAVGGWGLGATHDPDSGLTSFAVYAPAATRVVLEIYPADIGADASHRFDTVKSQDGSWRAQLSGLKPGAFYGYRCWGSNWEIDEDWVPGSLEGFLTDRDTEGNFFNPNKVLLDPYAREVSHVPLSPRITAVGADRGVFATGGGDYQGLPRRSVDSGRFAPKGVIVCDTTDTGENPERAAKDSIIYEGHLKNLTMHPSASRLGDILADEKFYDKVENVPMHLRGTYAGAAYLAPYLKGMGFTALELLPVHETDSDQVGDHNGTTNNWGYQTIGFFAPNRDYAYDKSPGGPTREFKQMVRTFHEHGIEVYLDVVYNHTAEGGNWDGDPDTVAFVSFGGFATTHYYDLSPDGRIIDGATGSTNQTNFSQRVTCDLVMDSLMYWHDVMGVDGFRFDLATVLGRFPAASDKDDWGGRRRFFNAHPLLREVADLAKDRNIEVIAEAWDLWGYEVGNFPSGWGEWNGRFRDAMRHFLKGDGNTRAFMDLFNGDWLHFNDNGGPQKSINFMTAHDGFTMFDLVSFNFKENSQPFPFGPSDGGADQNTSWDSGGDHGLRRTRWRNNYLVTMMSRGVPMIVSGDEYGRTQNGNNNPWNLNTVGIWNNWAQAASNAPTRLPVDPWRPEDAAYYDVVGQMDAPSGVSPMFRFARYITQLRELDPTLRQKSWGDEKLGSDNVTFFYYRPDLNGMPGPTDRCLTVLLNGAGVGGTDYLMFINMDVSPLTFKVPGPDHEAGSELSWHRLVDTAGWAECHNNCWNPADSNVITGQYSVEPWSIVVLAAASSTSPLFSHWPVE